MIRAVTFDFWRTLVVEPPDTRERNKQLRLEGVGSVLTRVGRPTPPAALKAAYEASGRALVEQYWTRHRDLPYQEQVRIFLEMAAPGVTADLPPVLFEDAVSAYITPVLRLLPVPVSGARETLTALRERGVALAIISNTGRTPGKVLRQVLEHYGLLGCFAAISYSDEVGFRKPHPAIFRQTLERLSVRPEHALHVGDDAVADVAGARSVGMRVCHFAAAGVDGPSEADLVLDDLRELPDRLDRLAEAPSRGF